MGYSLTFSNIYNVHFNYFFLFVLLHSVLQNCFKPELHDTVCSSIYSVFMLHLVALIYEMVLLFDSISLLSSVSLCVIFF